MYLTQSSIIDTVLNTVQIVDVQELHSEIEARAGSFQNFEAFGTQLLQNNHYASPEIQEKLDTLQTERDTLDKSVIITF